MSMGKTIAAIADATVVDFFRHDALIYGGALTFFALLALVPVLLMMASVIGYVVFFFSGGDAAAIDNILLEAARFGGQILPYAPDLKEHLWGIVGNRGKLSLVGFIALLLTASQIFRVTEQVLQRVFSSESTAAPVVQKQNIFLSKILFGVFVASLAISFIVFTLLGHVFFDLLKYVDPQIAKNIGNPVLVGSPAYWVASVAGASFIFALAIRMSSRIPISWRNLFIGGVLFSAMVVAVGKVFDLYVDNISSYLDDVYGSLGVAYIVLLWLYCLSLVFIFCVECVKVMHFGLPK